MLLFDRAPHFVHVKVKESGYNKSYMTLVILSCIIVLYVLHPEMKINRISLSSKKSARTQMLGPAGHTKKSISVKLNRTVNVRSLKMY